MTDQTPIWVYIILALALVVVVIFAVSLEIRSRRLERTRKLEFVQTISTGLWSGSITAPDDVYHVYNAVRGAPASSGKQPGRMIAWLQSVMLQMYKKQLNKYQKDQLPNHLQFLKNIVSDLEKDEPFSDLPTTERNLMSDILSFGLKHDDSMFTHKIQDLSGVIKARYEENAKLRENSKWANRISIVSFIVAVITLIIGIWNPFFLNT